MAARKRPRRRQSAVPGSPSRQGQAAQQRAQEAQMGVDYLSFAQAVTITGIDKTRFGAAVRRQGVPVYRSEVDRRKKFLRKEDLPKLTGFVPEPPPDTGDGAAAPDAN